MRGPRSLLTKFQYMLETALQKERKHWQQFNYPTTVNTSDDEMIGRDHRDETVTWLFGLSSYLRLNPETAILSANILDCFLHVVKARPKYLRCIAVSSLLIAAKVLEEDEMIPSVHSLVAVIMSPCSVGDILRMERIILEKLHWNVNKVTAMDFLCILHSILICNQLNLLSKCRHMTVGRQLTILIHKLLLCQQCSKVIAFPASTQALALISLELGLFTCSWLAITVMLQKLIQVDNKKLIQCREVMAAAISERLTTLYWEPTIRCANLKKRKVEHLEEDGDDADDIYDSIKRLYGDESVPAKEVMKKSSCGREIGSIEEATVVEVF